MNTKQTNTLEKIKNLMVHRHTNLELKSCTINSENEFFSQVTVVVGIPDDVGTMAEIICRDTATFHIGIKGGVERVSLTTNGNTNFSKQKGLVKALKFY